MEKIQLDPRVRVTALAMLKKRGYTIDVDDSEFTIIAEHPEKETIIVFFSEEMKIGITQIRAYIEEMKRLEIGHAILIIKGTYTSSATKGVLQAPVRIELFTEQETRIDITEHSLQPKFKLLNEDEINSVLNQYDIKLLQLPRMRKTDPIARFYGAKPRDVFKIIRPSETAGLYTSYRVVV